MRTIDNTEFPGKENLNKEVDTIRALHSESPNSTTATLTSTIAHECHIRVATMNINGLSKHELPVLLTYIKKKNIDVLSLQDTRLDEKEAL